MIFLKTPNLSTSISQVLTLNTSLQADLSLNKSLLRRLWSWSIKFQTRILRRWTILIGQSILMNASMLFGLKFLESRLVSIQPCRRIWCNMLDKQSILSRRNFTIWKKVKAFTERCSKLVEKSNFLKKLEFFTMTCGTVKLKLIRWQWALTSKP